jgi:hypothetical protein
LLNEDSSKNVTRSLPLLLRFSRALELSRFHLPELRPIGWLLPGTIGCSEFVARSQLEDKKDGFIKAGKLRVVLSLETASAWKTRQAIRIIIPTVVAHFPLPPCCIALVDDLCQQTTEETSEIRSAAFEQLATFAQFRCFATVSSLLLHHSVVLHAIH